MSGFIFVPIVRVRNVGFLAIVRNVVGTNCRGASYIVILGGFHFHRFLNSIVLMFTPVLRRFGFFMNNNCQ